MEIKLGMLSRGVRTEDEAGGDWAELGVGGLGRGLGGWGLKIGDWEVEFSEVDELIFSFDLVLSPGVWRMEGL